VLLLNRVIIFPLTVADDARLYNECEEIHGNINGTLHTTQEIETIECLSGGIFFAKIEKSIFAKKNRCIYHWEFIVLLIINRYHLPYYDLLTVVRMVL